jgi:PPK2 family polyphosphate:nucleotide phosphotransferase
MPMSLAKHSMVEPGKKLRLKHRDPDDTFGVKRDDKKHEKTLLRLRELQHLLYADKRYALLLVLQGLDAAGKDGTIRHVMSGVNPQGCEVRSFKAPSSDERARDYLWRIHRAVPPRGNIGIFNRSHYEDVLVVRVHGLVPKSVWQKRYHQINEFEQMLSESGVTIVKFLLYISKAEQAKRFQKRLDDKKKNWKFSPDDLKEREYWDAYIEAYDEVLEKCNTDYAPWYVIPANHKWFRNLAVAQVLVETMEEMKLRFPKAAADLSGISFE